MRCETAAICCTIAIPTTPSPSELKKAHFSVIAVKPERDKVTRMFIQTGKFESGQVFFPKQAPVDTTIRSTASVKHSGHELGFYDLKATNEGLERLIWGLLWS